MKKLVFESKDFSRDFMSQGISKDLAAQQAQAKFEEWFETEITSALVVYGFNPSDGEWTAERSSYDTMKARLVMIEKLEKQPCKHVPDNERWIIERGDIFTLNTKCKHCDVKLKATWEAAE